MATKKKAAKKDDLVRIGKRLQALRKQQGHTSYERFAFEYDIDRSQYGHYERGTKDMRMTTFLKICAALGVTAEEFFRGMK